MDAVQRGHSFTVTRGGHRIGELIPLRRRRRFVSRDEVRGNDEQDLYDEHAERARRLEILQRAESEFDPVPFDAEAARIYGRVTAAVIAAGRKPRRRTADWMITATAIAEDLPLFTANPADFAGLDALLRIMPVTRPDVPHEQPRSR